MNILDSHLKQIFKVFLSLVLICSTSYSQTRNAKDFEGWTTIGLEYKLNKKWNFEFEEQLRLKEDISEIDEYFTQLGIEYSVSKKVKIGGGVRYIRENDNKGKIQGYENHFRFQIDVSYKQKINALSFKYRVRYQNKNELGVGISEGDYANQHVRFKTSIGYNIENSKLKPKFSAEIYNHFEKSEEGGFDKYRLTIGTEYNLKKQGELNLFYRREKELNESIPKTKYIIGLKYVYKFEHS